MSNKFKLFTYLFIILLFIATYHDLKTDNSMTTVTIDHSSYSNYANKSLDFQVVSYQIKANEHFLSIIEKLNPETLINIETFISDFQALNPRADIYQLETNRIYLFPLYK